MWKSLYIILILFTLRNSSQAQKLELGFRIESLGLRFHYSNGTSEFSPKIPLCFLAFNTVQLTCAVYPIQDFGIEIRGGGSFGRDDYVGNEYGIYLRYFIFKDYYLTSGIAGHSNNENVHNTGSTLSSTTYMPAVGLGTKLGKVGSIELLYQKANDVILTSTTSPFPSEGTKTKHLNWMIKFGILFGWTL